MRQRFKARELWLFAPFLLIIAGAWYWARLEKVEPPNAQGIYVSDFKVEPALELSQSEGFSHQVTVTLGYKGSRPAWWGNATTFQNPIGAFDTKDFYSGRGKNDPAHALAYGATLTYRRDGKTLAWAPPNQINHFGARFTDEHYLFVHQVSLAQAPQKLGEIGFRGLYVISGQPPFAVTRTLRAAGEVMPTPAATGAGIKLLRVDATGFFQMESVAANGKKQISDVCRVRFTVRDFDAPPTSAKLPQWMWSNPTLTNEAGQSLEADTGNGLSLGWSEDGNDQKLLNGRRTGVLFVEVEPKYKLKGRLKCKGKISLGKRKPIAFEVTLPPYQSKPQVAGSFENFEIPLWRNGRAVS